jgi:hypothetical protein
MKAFITGSRAYGSPTPQSDVDLVVLVDSETLVKLRSLSDTWRDGSIRFGNLNLVALDSEQQFKLWEQGTQTLIDKSKLERRPITKIEAKQHFKSIGATGYSGKPIITDPSAPVQLPMEERIKRLEAKIRFALDHITSATNHMQSAAEHLK